ncbi:MAG: response regulator transcription factor [Rhodoferax sp.]|nr:response regulator transcription factor [Rhodoferax sp.]
MLRVLVVDDNPGFGMALRNIVGDWAGVQVLGLAQDGPAALERAALLRPDLVLMDIAMPGMDGLAVARRMRTWPQPPRIVLMSLNDGAAYRTAAAALGDVGFVGKGDILIELAPLVARMVADRAPEPGSQDRHSGA